tara:strand:+ start:167 stop:409 length:243 start_codon:yes stop_codon:yes gene_type:complete
MYEEIESSQKQHHNEIQQQMKVELLETEQQYKRFEMLKPKVYLDGDKWCVAYGEMPTGVFGFGNTPHEAVIDWEIQWNTK